MSVNTLELKATVTKGAESRSTLGGRIAELIRKTLAQRNTRRVVAGLSTVQLRDSGIDLASVLGNRPTIEVDAGLMAKLMSLR